MPPSKSNLKVEELLLRHGPMESSRLVEAFEHLGLSPEAARKRLSRARTSVPSLADLRLPTGGRFWYLREQFRSEDYWRNLVATLDDSGSAYGVALNAIEGHGGLIPIGQFPAISGSPLRGTGHLLAEKVLETVEALDLVEECDDPELGPCLRLTRESGFDVQETRERRATLLAEGVLLEAFKEWTRKLGLVSYEKVRIRGDATPPAFGAYQFDYSAPSYVYPLRSADGRPGFVVADVIFRDGVTAKQAGYFVRKCKSLRSAKGIYPFLAFLIAPGFDGPLFRQRSGFVLAATRNLFGEGIERALRELVRLVTDAAATAAGDGERILKVFESMSPFEGALQQLRGPLFELMTGYCLVRAEAGGVEIDRNVVDPRTGETANVDVLHRRGSAVAAYECKGRLSNTRVTQKEVEDWLTRQVPTIKGYLRSEPELRERRMTFAFWTTGTFSPDALAFLEMCGDATKRYEVSWKDGRAVREYARHNGLSEMVRLLDQFYQSAPKRVEDPAAASPNHPAGGGMAGRRG